MKTQDITQTKFETARENLKWLKETLFLSAKQIASRSYVKTWRIHEFFGRSSIELTPVIQSDIEKMVAAFGLNPDWVYTGRGRKFTNPEKLSATEKCAVVIDTPEKRLECIKRFEQIRMSCGLTYNDLADLAGVSDDIILKWLVERDPSTHVKYIPLMIKFCRWCSIRPQWLFLGRGSPQGDEKVKRIYYYPVIRTEIIENGGWVIIPGDYKIVTAPDITIAERQLPTELRYIDGQRVKVYPREIPIARCLTRSSAKVALQEEHNRIKHDGVRAWDAPWASIEIK